VDYGPLQPGDEPVPGYRLLKRLGQGGYGEVWRAHGPGGLPVALKFVRLAGTSGATELRALNLLRTVRHPNLLSTFGFWQQPGRLIIAMELADRTLLDRLVEAVQQGLSGIPRDELHRYFRDAAEALDHLNAARHEVDGKQQVGIQHRDVKPQNLLLVGGGVKVADFGLARLLEGAETGHTGRLTLSYAAPEFFRGHTSQWSDQYSLAITYCQLRGRRLPFVGNAAQITAGHLMHPPDLSMVPEEERAAVARALAKDPRQRWPTCRAFVEALRQNVTVPGAVAAGGGPRSAALVGTSPGASTAAPDDKGKHAFSQAETVDPPQGSTQTSSRRRTLPWKSLLWLGLALGAAVLVMWVSSLVFSRSPQRLTGHTAEVNSVAFHPDSKHLASASRDKTIKVWDIRTSRELRTLSGHKDQVNSVAYRPDGKQLASASDDQTVLIWDAQTGQLLLPLEGHTGWVTSVAYRRDGKQLASGSVDRSVRIWDAETGKPLNTFKDHHDGTVFSVAFSPDGKHLASASFDQTVKICDAATGQVTFTLRGHKAGIRGLAYSPDGKHLASASEDKTVKVWDTQTGQAVRTLHGHTAWVTSVAYSSDGKRLASGSVDQTVRVWDAQSGELLRTFTGHTGEVWGVAFSPDGKLLASASVDKTVRLWPVEKIP
jgi:serine/threonine protein kinase